VLVAGVSGHLTTRFRSPDVFAISGLVAAGALSAYLVVILLSSLPFMRNQEVEAIRLRARFLPCWRDAESAIAMAVLWTSEWVSPKSEFKIRRLN